MYVAHRLQNLQQLMNDIHLSGALKCDNLLLVQEI